MLAHFSLLSAAWAHFSRLAAFVVPFARFFRDLGRFSLDFGKPSWPYVGTFVALGGIFRHGAGIAAKNPAGISFLFFVSTMQRGGTCEAHPPPPEGRAERAKFPLKFFQSSSCLNI